jgi:hypothetical protein
MWIKLDAIAPSPGSVNLTAALLHGSVALAAG